MLKKILFFVLIINAFFGLAQIPNAGFESVTAGKPNGWNVGAYSVYPLRDTSVSNSGVHAAAFYGSVPPAFNGALAQDFVQASSRPTQAA